MKRIAPELQERASSVARALPQLNHSLLPEPVAESLASVWACSDFVADWCARHGERFQALAQAGFLTDSPGPAERAPRIADLASAAQVMQRLRRWRNEWMLRIAWRDLAGWASLEDTLSELSWVADACVAAALDWVLAQAPDCQHSPVVVAMGKLGGKELNFSSDIDLIFAYATPSAGAQGVQQQLIPVAQRLIALLSELTVDGFVFRVDTRLRPFGDSGALVASINAMENYYQIHGREWERYAWIKARPIAGDMAAGRELIERLRPFVYRRYLDYGAFESLRDMKALINKQVARRDLQDNIKLGRGGIREIEFIVQAFQLVRGGHEPALQDTRLRPVLAYLGAEGYLPTQVTDELGQAYAFLRRLENRLQMWTDRQTHDLPTDPTQQAALAAAMGHDDWSSLLDALAGWQQKVQAHFQQVFAAPHVDTPISGPRRALADAWRDDGDVEQGQQALAALGYVDCSTGWKALAELRSGALYTGLGHRGRRRLAELVPLVAAAAATAEDPDQALSRVVAVLARIVGRTAYVDLLVENPAVLSRLVTLCSASPWISTQIQAQPILLDSLLDPRLLYHPPAGRELACLLERALAAVPEADLERRMDALRRFHHEQILRVAAADVSNSMPLMIVSDHLTALAEVVVRAALAEAWRGMIARHGQPLRADGSRAEFVVVGYGKLGGLELGYGSDLDLVFVHEGRDADSSDGGRPLTHPTYFLRLAQRTIHLLSTQTSAGRAYEVDTRLRPSGRSGLLVVGMTAFAHYQTDKAWTWEHQALVRARPVAGDEPLCVRFCELRNRLLAQPREVRKLGRDVGSMRRKMRVSLEHRSHGQWDLKQGSGGLVDIEFIAQYAVLRYARDCPELLLFTDTIRILETLESAQLLDYDTTKALTDAYRAYRKRGHATALQQHRAMLDDAQLRPEREAVADLWQAWLGGDAGAEGDGAAQDDP